MSFFRTAVSMTAAGPRKGEPSTRIMRYGFRTQPAPSPRQLPTDHVHAVSTRAYQCDQSSRLPPGCYRHCCPEVFPFALPAEYRWRRGTVKDSRRRAARVLDSPSSPPKLLRSSKRKEKQAQTRTKSRGLTRSLHINLLSVSSPHSPPPDFPLALSSPPASIPTGQ